MLTVLPELVLTVLLEVTDLPEDLLPEESKPGQ
jgi:hypothetical protein